MKRYEYRFVEITPQSSLQKKKEDPFELCRQTILQEASQGWRLKQVVVPWNEKMGAYGTKGYQIILEREEPVS